MSWMMTSKIWILISTTNGGKKSCTKNTTPVGRFFVHMLTKSLFVVFWSPESNCMNAYCHCEVYCWSRQESENQDRYDDKNELLGFGVFCFGLDSRPVDV